MRLRIAHIGSKGIPTAGGTERVVEAIAVRHAAAHDVTVYGRADVQPSGSYRNVRLIGVGASRRKYVGPVSLALSCALRARDGGYDIIHVHGAENAFILPFLRGKNVVTTNHGPAYRREKWGHAAKSLMRALERPSVTMAGCATAVSEAQADHLSRLSRRPVTYIPNGVGALQTRDQVGALRLLQEQGIGTQPFVLFAAGRVDPTKGCHTLIEAYRLERIRTPLLVAGDLWHAPGYEAELRQRALGLPIHFVPKVPPHVLAALLSRCRFFVFPSTVEGMSMMLLEALSTGSACLVSDIPENTAAIPAGCPTFRAGHVGDLAAKLEALLEASDEELTALGAEGSEWVESHFGWDAIARQYEEVYFSVVGSAGGVRSTPATASASAGSHLARPDGTR